MKILVLDIETTGFFPKGKIVEIGIVSLDLDNGNIEEIFSSLLREEGEIKKGAWIFENSDLTLEEVLAAPPAHEVFAEVQDIIRDIGVTAYNKSFDFTFLKDRGLIIKELPCPMLLATPVCKIRNSRGYKRPKVQEAFDFFFPEIEYVEKHRGLDDARHEAMIVWKLWELGVFET